MSRVSGRLYSKQIPQCSVRVRAVVVTCLTLLICASVSFPAPSNTPPQVRPRRLESLLLMPGLSAQANPAGSPMKALMELC